MSLILCFRKEGCLPVYISKGGKSLSLEMLKCGSRNCLAEVIGRGYLYQVAGLIQAADFDRVKVTQLCLTLCDPMHYTVPGILQARILEWVAFPFSRGSSQPRDGTQVSHIAGGFFTS